jgi:hypothetical protein
MATTEQEVKKERRPLSDEERRVLGRLSVRLMASRQASGWPEYADGVPRYVNRDKEPSDPRRTFKIRNEEEARFFFGDSPRYLLARGGDGGGKSVIGSCKTLERVRKGMSGIMVSPDFEHFKKSLWQEFRRWVPEETVDKSDRHMLAATWEPTRAFDLHFRSEAGKTVTLHCGGIEDPESWRGPNVHFAYFDEASKHKTAKALKFLDGRVRLTGPQGEKDQIYLTTTPEMNWLYEYFGPLQEGEDGQPDPLSDFKGDSFTICLPTEGNSENLSPDFARKRRQTLTAAEARVYLEGQWEDISDTPRFLDSMVWWDACKEALPPLNPYEPLICGMDAGVSDDPFGLVGVSKHPYRRGVLCPRLIMLWRPTKGRQLDFDLIQGDIEALKGRYNILSIHYDPYQLHQLGTRLRNTKVFHTVEFKQGGEVNTADKGLLDLITERKVAWSAADENSALLYDHLSNADRKLDENRKIRMVKRTHSKKIDLARAFSMACHRGMNLWRPKPRIQGTSAAGVF